MDGVKVFDGTSLAQSIIDEIKNSLVNKQEKPCLAVVCVGTRKDVDSFIRSKLREAKQCGIDVLVKRFEPNISEQELLQEVSLLNQNILVDGIVLQQPLPSHIRTLVVSQALSYDKDVDGFHKENLGLLAIPEADPLFIPCTALSVLRILEAGKVVLRGAHCVIIGASANVGIPLLLLLTRRGATVTLSHIYTRDLPQHTARADIVVSAAGVANLISPQHVRPGAVVVDVGINYVPDASKATGFRLVGDVDFENVAPLCSLITPVPGGVGPVTSAIVLHQTAESFLRFRSKRRNSLELLAK